MSSVAVPSSPRVRAVALPAVMGAIFERLLDERERCSHHEISQDAGRSVRRLFRLDAIRVAGGAGGRRRRIGAREPAFHHHAGAGPQTREEGLAVRPVLAPAGARAEPRLFRVDGIRHDVANGHRVGTDAGQGEEAREKGNEAVHDGDPEQRPCRAGGPLATAFQPPDPLLPFTP